MDPISIKAFENKYKTEDRHPDFKGRYNGVQVAVWKQKDSDGKTCLSIKVEEDNGGGKSQPRRAKSTNRDADLNVGEEDLPF